MRTARHPHRHPLVVAAAVLLLLAGLALESTLLLDTVRARGSLARTPARAAPDASPAEAAALLAAEAEATPSPAARSAAAVAARAAGEFDAAARHAQFARRLAPSDAGVAAAAERAVDLALLARLRLPARLLALASAIVLVLLAVRVTRRRRHHRRLTAWLDGLRPRLALRVDGEAAGDCRSASLPPDARAVTLDVFLDPLGPHRHPPRPGPTLAVVLSQAGSNRTLRLTPRRDVRDDAVRVRIRDETLARILGRPGRWRLRVRLDDRVVGELDLVVPKGQPARRRRGLRLLATK